MHHFLKEEDEEGDGKPKDEPHGLYK